MRFVTGPRRALLAGVLALVLMALTVAVQPVAADQSQAPPAAIEVPGNRPGLGLVFNDLEAATAPPTTAAPATTTTRPTKRTSRPPTTTVPPTTVPPTTRSGSSDRRVTGVRRRRLLAPIALLLVAAAACGDDDGDTSTGGPGSTEPAPVDRSSTPPARTTS